MLFLTFNSTTFDITKQLMDYELDRIPKNKSTANLSSLENLQTTFKDMCGIAQSLKQNDINIQPIENSNEDILKKIKELLSKNKFDLIIIEDSKLNLKCLNNPNFPKLNIPIITLTTES